MKRAVDQFGVELKEGDVVLFTSYGHGTVCIGRFSHATEKKLMVKVPYANVYSRFPGFYWSQQISAGLTKLDSGTFDRVSQSLDEIDAEYEVKMREHQKFLKEVYGDDYE